MEDVFTYIGILISIFISLSIVSDIDLKENENVCYNFKSFDGLEYQAKYSNCSGTKNGLRCQIDNKVFYIQEFEKVICDTYNQ